MPYSRLLKKIIVESGYTSTQIVEECKKRGKSIDKAYISKLMNGKVPPPREELSRIIASICNVNEKALILEGYIDKAPKEILEALNSIRNKISSMGLKAAENLFSEEEYDIIQKEMEKEPIAEFILDLIDAKDEKIDIKETMLKLPITENELKTMLKGKNTNELSISIREPISIIVTDNGMFPLVPEKSKIIIEIKEKYTDGEILAVKVKKEENFIVRYALFKGDTVILTALNNEYPIRKYELNDIVIIGKVKKVITDI